MNIFIGGAWPYANNSLHVGHLAALLPGDIIARYYRKKGANVIYVSGTDSHGTPITVRARREGVNPSLIASQYHKEFNDCFKKLYFSYNIYSTTYSSYHKQEVRKYFKKIFANNYIYEKQEEQDYCSKCKRFLSDREIEGICPHCNGIARGDQCEQCLMTINAEELKNKKCKECGTKTSMKKTVHLYFALSKFQKSIQKLVQTNKKRWRLAAINETQKYLKNGLQDRAATRDLSWGVDVPINSYEDKKIYVWIEAVLGYLTAGKEYATKENIDFEKFIKKSKKLRTYYVHGKDNIPFHTIIYPALILATGLDIQLPDFIISSQYMNIEDKKMSKSTGNMITVNELLTLYSPDSIRSYMVANNPDKKDKNFSFSELELYHNKHLVGEYGNLANRIFIFLNKNNKGVVPKGEMDPHIKEQIISTYKKVGNRIEHGDTREALEHSFRLVKIANKYFDMKKPWLLVKEDYTEYQNVIYTCINLISNIANILEPFMPQSSGKINKILGEPNLSWKYQNTKGGRKLKKISLIFNKL